MGIGNGKPWSDDNRFNQSGYSAMTLFPKRRNYESMTNYIEDMEKATYRESNHNEFLDELRQEYAEERYCEEHDCEE